MDLDMATKNKKTPGGILGNKQSRKATVDAVRKSGGLAGFRKREAASKASEMKKKATGKKPAKPVKSQRRWPTKKAAELKRKKEGYRRRMGTVMSV